MVGKRKCGHGAGGNLSRTSSRNGQFLGLAIAVQSSQEYTQHLVDTTNVVDGFLTTLRLTDTHTVGLAPWPCLADKLSEAYEHLVTSSV